MSVTDEIKSRLDIVDIIGESVQLRKSGRSYAGLCPFHPNTRTPAFYVFPHTQTWYCFGACAEGGDLFSFLMKKEGRGFREVLEEMARRAGVTLEPLERKSQTELDREQRLIGLLAAAADYYHQLLLYAPQAESVRRYVADRALAPETVAHFKLGYALNSWDAAKNHFAAQGYDQADLLAAGLLTENEERGTTYDRFRHRLMFPIRDHTGRITGFGARTLDPDGIPKYLNSPQTDLFDKSRILYGLGDGRREIQNARQAVIVEGYMDVIQAWQAGYRNVVAQMGTALTGDQLRLLKRHTKRFVLALDADAAGASATLRSLSVARETLDRTAEVRFDARGLVHHEGRLQADIRIVTLPAGEDPDSLIRRDPAAWPALLEGAQPVVAYVIEMAAGQLDPADAKAKTAIARQVLPLIGDIADAVERDHYLQLLGRRLAVDERALRRLWAEMTARPSTGSGRRRSPPARTAHQAIGFPPDRSANGGSVDSTSMPPQRPSGMVALATQMRQANYLRQVLEHRHLLELVDRRLQGVGQPAVNIKEFDSVEDRALLSHLREQIEGGTMGDVEELSAALDPTLRQHVRYLLQLPATPEGELQRLPDTLAMSILDWRLEKVKALLREVSALFRDAREHDQSELLDMHKQQLRALPALLSQIDMAKFSLSSQSRRDG